MWNQLPVELHGEVCLYLGRSELRVLSMVSRSLRACSQPLLFREISFAAARGLGRMQERMEGLAASQNIANAVKKIKFQGLYYTIPGAGSENIQSSNSTTTELFFRLLPCFRNVVSLSLVYISLSSSTLSAIQTLSGLASISATSCVIEEAVSPTTFPVSTVVLGIGQQGFYGGGTGGSLAAQVENLKLLFPTFISSSTLSLTLHLFQLKSRNHTYSPRDFWDALPLLPNLKSLTLEGENPFEFPGLDVVLRRFPGVEQLWVSCTDAEDYPVPELDSSILPNLKSYSVSGCTRSIAPLMAGRPVRHLRFAEVVPGNILPAKNCDQLISVEIQHAWSDFWDPGILGVIGNCKNLRALAFSGFAEKHLDATFKHCRLPPNLEMLWFSVFLFQTFPGPEMAHNKGLALRQRFQTLLCESLPNLKNLSHISFEVYDFHYQSIYAWVINPQTGKAIVDDIPIKEWRDRELLSTHGSSVPPSRLHR